jgi:hypothetical protein
MTQKIWPKNMTKKNMTKYDQNLTKKIWPKKNMTKKIWPKKIWQKNFIGKIKTHFLCSVTFFTFENRAVY